MTTLADINDTLIMNRQVLGAKQTYTSARVDALAAGFKKFTDLLESESNADDLDALGDRDRVGKTPPDLNTGDGDTKGGKGRFFDFDVGNLLPLLGGMLGGFLRRAPLALIAAMLADEVAEGVKNLTGSDILANVAEWSLMGGAIGFLFGAKFGLIGAMLGALFSEASRTKIAETLSEFLGKQIEATDKETYAAAFAIAGLGALVPTLIKALMPFLLGPKGLAIAALAALTGVTYKYFTDEEFKKKIDASLQPLKDKISSFIDQMIEATKVLLDSIFDPLATTMKEKAARDKILGKDIVATRDEAEDKLSTNQVAAAAVRSAQSRFGEFRNEKSTKENVLTALEQVGLSSDPEVAEIVASNADGDKLADALIKHFGGKIDEAKTTLAPIRQQEVQVTGMAEVQERILDAESIAEVKSKRDSLKRQIQALEKLNPLMRRNVTGGGNLEKLQSQLAFAEQELARRTAGTQQQSRILSPAVIDASTTNNGSSTTVITPPIPSANNSEDPVREVVVF